MAARKKPDAIDTVGDLPLPSLTMSVREAAALMNRSTRFVQKLVEEGHVTRTKAGRYDLVALVRGMVTYFEEQMAKSTKAAIASRATESRAREIELRIAERCRELIPLDDAKTEVARIVSDVRAEIVGLGARVTRDLELRRQIDQETDGILARLADRSQAAGLALETGVDTVEAGGEAVA